MEMYRLEWRGDEVVKIPMTDEQKKVKRSLFERAMKKLVQVLPPSTAVDVNDLIESGIAERLAFFYLVLYLVVLLSLLVAGTLSEQRKEYLSVKDPGRTTAICKQEPISVTGEFLADSAGRWSSNKEFDPSMAIYSVAFSGTSVTEGQFRDVMRKLSAQIQTLGQKMTEYDVIRSRIAWSFFTIGDNSTKITFRPNAQLQEMFILVEPYQTPVFSSYRGVCQPKERLLQPTYDYYTNTLHIDFPYAPSPEFCPDQLSIIEDSVSNTFGLGGTKDTSSIDVDVVQLALAFALNFGITDTAFLSKKDSSVVSGTTFNFWVHDRYPDMRPVKCVTSPGKPRVCFGVIGSTLTSVFPVFTSATSDKNQKNETACECPRHSQNFKCNAGVGQPIIYEEVQIELLFATKPCTSDANRCDLDGSFLSSMQNLQQLMADKSVNGPNEVQRMVSELAFTAVVYADWPSFYQIWKDGYILSTTSSYLSYADFSGNFKKNLGAGVSMMTVLLLLNGPLNSQGVSLAKLSSSSLSLVNPYAPDGSPKETLKGLMCQDSLYRADALAKMAETPPVKLVQPYYSCSATPFQAFITSAGLAAANTSLLTTLVLSFVISGIVFYFGKFRNVKFVSPAEKAEIRNKVEMDLMANAKSLRSNDDRLFTENRRLIEEVAALREAFIKLRKEVRESAPSPDSKRDSIPDRRSLEGAYDKLERRMSQDNPMHQTGDGATRRFSFSWENANGVKPRASQRLSSNEDLQQAIFSDEQATRRDLRRLSHSGLC